jgi:hypothetical protein
MRLGDPDFAKAQALVKIARRIQLQDLKPNWDAPHVRFFNESYYNFSADASALM